MIGKSAAVGFLMLGMAIGLSRPAQAEDLPHYDVPGHCNQIASVSGAPSDTLLNACMDQEQDAYNAVKAEWSSLPDTMQAHCDQIATVSGPGSYAMLKACIDQEQDAAAHPHTFQY